METPFPGGGLSPAFHGTWAGLGDCLRETENGREK